MLPKPHSWDQAQVSHKTYPPAGCCCCFTSGWFWKPPSLTGILTSNNRKQLLIHPYFLGWDTIFRSATEHGAQAQRWGTTIIHWVLRSFVESNHPKMSCYGDLWSAKKGIYHQQTDGIQMTNLSPQIGTPLLNVPIELRMARQPKRNGNRLSQQLLLLLFFFKLMTHGCLFCTKHGFLSTLRVTNIYGSRWALLLGGQTFW